MDWTLLRLLSVVGRDFTTLVVVVGKLSVEVRCVVLCFVAAPTRSHRSNASFWNATNGTNTRGATTLKKSADY